MKQPVFALAVGVVLTAWSPLEVSSDVRRAGAPLLEASFPAASLPAASLPAASLPDTVEARAAELSIAQVQYDGGGDWYANPSALPNLLAFIAEETGLPVSTRPGQVRLTDPGLRDYPYLYLTGHGNVKLSAAEVASLREYLEGGGFLHADDNYGLDESFRREMVRVFPDAELVPVPHDHPVYHVYFDFPEGLPKIHEHDGEPPSGLGIFHEGRLVVFYSYESDLGNGWEDAEVHGNPEAVRTAALRMGLNLFLYSLSQVVS